MSKPKAHNKAFGTVLATQRRTRHLSQEDLAFEADLTRAYVSLLERGLRSPTLDSMIRLCHALDMDLDVLAKSIVRELASNAR